MDKLIRAMEKMAQTFLRNSEDGDRRQKDQISYFARGAAPSASRHGNKLKTQNAT